MKKVIGAATATVFGLGAFTTTATAETIVTADVLNVREKPTTESKVVEKVKNGEELKVINTEDGWSKIELNGKEVFVSSEFTKDIYHVTADLLNVRSESNTESKILGRLKKDDVIESTNQVKDGWLQFEYKGKTAYVNVSFLSSKAPVEKKADEKTKQVAKVQKSVKAKEEAKTQKITKAKETIKPKEEVKVQEVVKPKEEVKVQEVAKPKEEVKVQEVAKPKEEVKVQEVAKPKEEVKVQEVVKPKEEVKVQEVAKAKEEAKAQEIAKAKEEAKAQEIAKAKEEAKAQEIAKAKEEAKAQEIAKAKEEAKAREALKAKEESKNNAQSAKRELTVVATAYTADPSENGTYGGRVLTAMGHDLTANPNMRIIAVDPKVIPLGSKVWVEGYGEAIAGDTGSAIKGNRIDVLMGSKSKAMNWGRQTVKVKIL
ncbi:TPA: SH3 domain-containing protein [Bacillus anthracis]|uniref:cell wall-binding protein EntB n=4 Tax=Bacillus anthracis TaxID=1392 RepID=UPI0005A3295B|nr:cell wall-binding protein EntB [Bacillus anthracis]AJG69841.1 3D domain protein [Bacillus anthracis]AJH43528.1 3D domain protein [Bacillus anthracis str. Sterne]OXM03190.1 enterotoxin [Bacillus anthracis]HDR4086971.1 SH3 domain-containing protein [Bacillus anthracis]HDR4216253.1 SH3 domain-containing protein [Bacillus anthracis]